MMPEYRKKALAAIKRMDGLNRKLAVMIEGNAYCPDILEQALAVQGHVKHLQALVLESHLHTCAPKKLSSIRDRKTFVHELLDVIGLSRR